MAKQTSINSSITANGVQVGNTTATGVNSTVLADGQLLIGSTGAAPVAATLSAGAGISITPGAGSLTITNTGGGGGGVASITGINGLDATDTGGGAYEVGIAAVAPNIATSGLVQVLVGDGLATGGRVYLGSSAMPAGAVQEGTITLEAFGSDNTAQGQILITAYGGQSVSNGLLKLAAEGQNFANNGQVIMTANQLPITATTAQTIIGCGTTGGNPNDCRLTFERAGDGSVNTIDMQTGAYTETVGTSVGSANSYYELTSTYAAQTNSLKIGDIGGGIIGHRFTVDPVARWQINDGTYNLLDFNGQAATAQSYWTIDTSFLPAPQVAPALAMLGTDQFGTAVLAAGTVTVSVSWITTANVVVATHRTLGGTAVGHLQCDVTAGSFTINSLKTNQTLETDDDSTVQYWII